MVALGKVARITQVQAEVQAEVAQAITQPRRSMSMLSDDERLAVVELYQNSTLSVKQIVEECRLTNETVVINLVKKLGVPFRVPQRSHEKKVSAPAQNLEQEIESAKARLAELETRKAEQAIRFESLDEVTVVIHGVTERFVRSEGMAKLLQYINHRHPQVK